jgi:hypothetical protein
MRITAIIGIFIVAREPPRQPTPPPKVGQKGPPSLAFAVAHHFLTVSKTGSLHLYGPIGEDGAPNGPPQLILEPPQGSAMAATGSVSLACSRVEEESLPATEVEMSGSY